MEVRLVHDEVAEIEGVQPRDSEAPDRIVRTAHDRLIAEVKRGVDDHRNARGSVEELDESPEAVRRPVPGHSLWTSSPVDVHDSGRLTASRRRRPDDLRHASAVCSREVLGTPLLQNRGSKGPIALATLHRGVNAVAGLGLTRVAEDTAST